VKKSDKNQEKIIRNYCKRRNEGLQYECWQYEYMIEQHFALGEIYRVCRKCIYFNPQIGGIVNKKTLDKMSSREIHNKAIIIFKDVINKINKKGE